MASRWASGLAASQQLPPRLPGLPTLLLSLKADRVNLSQSCQSALFPSQLQQQLMLVLRHQLDGFPPSHSCQSQASSSCSQFPNSQFCRVTPTDLLWLLFFSCSSFFFFPILTSRSCGFLFFSFFCCTKPIFPTLVFTCESSLGFLKQIWELKEVVFLVSSCWLYKHSFTFYTLLGFSYTSTCA